MRNEATVLVVDDEEVVRRLLGRTLEAAGYRVLSADHGRSALELLEREAGRVDLVVTDLDMPVLDGRALGRRVAEQWPHVRLLFISGFPREALEARHLFVADAPFLKKPFLPSRLTEAVADALAQPTRARTP